MRFGIFAIGWVFRCYAGVMSSPCYALSPDSGLVLFWGILPLSKDPVDGSYYGLSNTLQTTSHSLRF